MVNQKNAPAVPSGLSPVRDTLGLERDRAIMGLLLAQRDGCVSASALGRAIIVTFIVLPRQVLSKIWTGALYGPDDLGGCRHRLQSRDTGGRGDPQPSY